MLVISRRSRPSEALFAARSQSSQMHRHPHQSLNWYLRMRTEKIMHSTQRSEDFNAAWERHPRRGRKKGVLRSWLEVCNGKCGSEVVFWYTSQRTMNWVFNSLPLISTLTSFLPQKLSCSHSVVRQSRTFLHSTMSWESQLQITALST